MRYRTIVADPPWDISRWAGIDDSSDAFCPYATLSTADIAALDIAELCAPDCDLYLWTINEFVRDAFAVADAWGFTFGCLLVWCKEGGGPVGGRFPSNVEFALHGSRRAPVRRERRQEELEAVAGLRDALRRSGKPRAEIDLHFGTKNVAGHWFTPNELAQIPPVDKWPWLRDWLAVPEGSPLDRLVVELNTEKGVLSEPRQKYARADSRWFTWPRQGRHSQKPEAFYDLVEQVSPGPYLELFARRQRLGWDTWGDEALQHVELSA